MVQKNTNRLRFIFLSLIFVSRKETSVRVSVRPAPPVPVVRGPVEGVDPAVLGDQPALLGLDRIG